MRLTSVYLEKFRNYTKLKVATDSDLVLILGDNASGKTNFLEGIYFLSNLKSFRTPDNFLVKENEDYFNIKGKYSEQTLEVTVQSNPLLRRSFKINGIKVKRAFWQTFMTVLFVPNDLNLFVLGPNCRRKFLDETLSQYKKGYALDLASFDHVLKQRAALLEKIFQNQSSIKELEIWNRELVPLALSISASRREYLKFLQDRFVEFYGKITGFNNSFKILYKGIKEGVDEETLHKILAEQQAAEISSGQNLVGPHRDDFTIEKDGKLNVYNSSRGELRSQVLALKLLQAVFLSHKENKPIILLDDVFSELDEIRRVKLLENLSGYQIFISSTEEHHLPKIGPTALILKVEDDLITKKK